MRPAPGNLYRDGDEEIWGLGENLFKNVASSRKLRICCSAWASISLLVSSTPVVTQHPVSSPAVFHSQHGGRVAFAGAVASDQHQIFSRRPIHSHSASSRRLNASTPGPGAIESGNCWGQIA